MHAWTVLISNKAFCFSWRVVTSCGSFARAIAQTSVYNFQSVSASLLLAFQIAWDMYNTLYHRFQTQCFLQSRSASSIFLFALLFFPSFLVNAELAVKHMVDDLEVLQKQKSIRQRNARTRTIKCYHPDTRHLEKKTNEMSEMWENINLFLSKHPNIRIEI